MLVLDRFTIFITALLVTCASSITPSRATEKAPERTAESSRDPLAVIKIFPNPIYVSQDYPARFIAVQTARDGSSLDRTRDVAAALMAKQAAQQGGEAEQEKQVAALIVEADGTLKCNPTVSAPPTVELSTLVDGQPIVLHVQVSESPSASPSFPREISAILGKAGCNLGTCHGNLHGKGGLRLSLRGDDARFDYGAIVRGDAGRRINSFAAELSLLLTKPSGQLAHQGGVRFDLGSRPYELMKRWIEEGCQWSIGDDLGTNAIAGDDPADTLVKLNVYPTEALLAPASRAQQLVVTATFGDGFTRDVTAWARYEPSLVSDVAITADGLVTADKPLDVSVSVSYLSGRAASRLTFLPEQSESLQQPESLPSVGSQLAIGSQRVDEIVERQLQRMRLHPTELAADNVLLRRLYLVVVGRLPTVAETKEYLASTEPDKRERLIEQLLNNSGYAALWAMRWSDLLRNEQKVMSPEGARGWHAWITKQVSDDRPLNEFVAEMITTVGSTYEHPPASFHRTHRDPETAAESIGQVFLGVRLQCARCHNHPFDKWRQDDYYGLAAYFTTLERKQVDNAPKDKFDKHIISGDEVISLSDKDAAIVHPGRAASVPPKPLTDTYANDAEGNAVTDRATEGVGLSASPLESLAAWLTNDNRLFARNMANRVWYHLMGRGVVDPPDDFRDSNPASNPALLEYLTDELIRSNYSVRYLSKLILTSRTFARSAVDDVRSQGLDAEANFAGYPMRRLSAEVLMDALSDVTQVASKMDEDAAAPTSMQRAIVRAEVPAGSGFLATFGKPNRLLVCECERSNAVSLGQSLMLVNGADMRTKLSESRNRITSMLEHKSDLTRAIEDLYLATLTRYPTDVESNRMNEYVTQSTNQRAALEDVLWALINSQEFAIIR